MDKKQSLLGKKSKAQKGAMILSVISSILVVMGFFCFAVVFTSSNQVKKIQSMIIIQQEKNHAKASLDCAIALFNQSALNISNLDISVFEQCKTSERVSFSIQDEANYWLLKAQKGYAKATSLIRYNEPEFASLTITGDVKIVNGNTWFSAINSQVKDEANCLGILAKGEVMIDLSASVTNFSIRPENQSINCKGNNTFAVAGTVMAQNKEAKDIQTRQSALDPFYLLFNLEKAQWQKVKNAFDHSIITGSAIKEPESVMQCGAAIKKALLLGHQLIWVEGDCLLNGLTGIDNSMQSPLIVIKDGIVGATEKIDELKVTLFQVLIDHTASKLRHSWGIMASNQCAEGAMKPLCLSLLASNDHSSLVWTRLAFYFLQSVQLKGSYFIDIPNSLALIDKEFSLGFDAKLKEHSVIKGLPKILKASLHDL